MPWDSSKTAVLASSQTKGLKDYYTTAKSVTSSHGYSPRKEDTKKKKTRLQAGSDEILAVGTAWEQGYIDLEVV